MSSLRTLLLFHPRIYHCKHLSTYTFILHIKTRIIFLLFFNEKTNAPAFLGVKKMKMPEHDSFVCYVAVVVLYDASS